MVLSYLATAVDINPLPNHSAAGAGQISTILGIVFAVVGALAVLMIVVSGLRYILSAGDPRKAAEAKEGVIYAVIGVAIAISAEAIISFVLGKF